MSDNVNIATVEQGTDHLSRDPRIAPQPNQPFTALSEMLASQYEGPDEPKQPVALPLVGEQEWRFRTKPGRASTSMSLRLPIETDDVDENVLRKNKYKRWLDRQIKQGKIDEKERGKDGLLKSDKAVFDLLGEYHIKFTGVRVNGRRAMEAQYTTTEKVVADYIRGRLEKGEFANEIYEEVRPVTMSINGQVGRFLPADEATRLAMAAAAAG